MANFLTKVESMLLAYFPGADLDLNFHASDRTVGGALVWKGFSRKSPSDRRAMLSEAIQIELGDEWHSAAYIFPMTPQEYRIQREERLQEEEQILHAAKGILEARRKRTRELRSRQGKDAATAHRSQANARESTTNGLHRATKKRKLNTHG
jgi:hypothetical protein